MPRRWTRHHCHLITYALVSFSLMFMGMIFSVFAIFVKESDLSKVWLAGPTTIAVGLVLCGKVIIDCRPTIELSDCDEDVGDEESLEEPEDKAKTVVHKNLVSSIDAQYEKQKQEVSLFIPNLGAKDKEVVLLSSRNTKSPQTDTESDVWNPRTSVDEEIWQEPMISGSSTMESKSEDCLCVLSNPQAEVALPHNHAPVTKPSVVKSTNQSEKRKKLSLSKELQFPRETKPFVEDNPSPLYQGETFVLHEKQYLI